MNKLEMAHEYVMNYMASPDCKDTTVSNIVSVAWSYADLMQAEADKRVVKLPDIFFDAKLDADHCLEYEIGRNYPPDAYVMYNGKKTLAVSINEEWQPDWSQAPENTTHWGVELGSAYWIKEEGNGLFCKIGKAPLFGYTGSQQESLRKRPN